MLPDLSPFIALRRYLAIAHHVPGRIRVKLDVAALGRLQDVDTQAFVDLAQGIRGVKAVRVNAAALSAVIEYDAARIAASVWERLLRGDRTEVEAILRDHFARAAHPPAEHST